MENREFITRMMHVFQSLDRQVRDPKEIQKLRDAGKSEDFIEGCHSMFHAISVLIGPLMRDLIFKTVMMEGLKKEKQEKATTETISKLESTDDQVRNPEDISDDVKEMLRRFKGPMQ